MTERSLTCHVQLQPLCHLLRTWAFCTNEQRADRTPFYYVDESVYHSIYETLLSQRRFWGLQNLITEMTAFFDIEDAWYQALSSPYGDDMTLQNVVQDWVSGPYDNSSHLALLETLVALSGYPLSKQPLLDKDNLAPSKCILQQARMVASTIEARSPDLEARSPNLIKSWPYIRWILAEAEHNRLLEGDTIRRHLPRFPGVTVYRSLVPIYIPMACENSGWPEVHGNSQHTRLVQIALNTAREIEDHQTEVLCLQKLICRSSRPSELLNQLKRLQKVTEGNVIAYRQSCLSAYLLQPSDFPDSLWSLQGEYHLADSPDITLSTLTTSLM